MSFLDKVLRAGDGKRVKALQGLVPDVNALEASYRALSDEALQAKTGEFRQKLANGADLNDILIDAFATMREAVKDLGGDPEKIEPLAPAELVIDHSVIADFFGTADAADRNEELEYERNQERYQFLRWGQGAFEEFKVVPPGQGIVHQVNIEALARVVMARGGQAYPDTVVGTDSHTTMVNGLGVLGWGVGGIEAEAAMLGQPISMLIPEVIGFKLTGKLPAGATATDLVLVVTEMLLIAMAVIWGCNFTVNKYGTQVLEPLVYTTIRMVAGTIAMMVLVLAGRKSKATLTEKMRLLMLGLLGHGAYQLLFIYGIARTRAGTAALVIASSPAIIAIVMRTFRHERLAQQQGFSRPVITQQLRHQQAGRRFGAQAQVDKRQ